MRPSSPRLCLLLFPRWGCWVSQSYGTYEDLSLGEKNSSRTHLASHDGECGLPLSRQRDRPSSPVELRWASTLDGSRLSRARPTGRCSCARSGDSVGRVHALLCRACWPPVLAISLVSPPCPSPSPAPANSVAPSLRPITLLTLLLNGHHRLLSSVLAKSSQQRAILLPTAYTSESDALPADLPAHVARELAQRTARELANAPPVPPEPYEP